MLVITSYSIHYTKLYELVWRTGVGLGLISVDYEEQFFDLSEVNKRSITTSGIDFFTEFDYMISSYSSFGLMADYVFVPGKELSVPSHDVKLGNASIGFKLGLLV